MFILIARVECLLILIGPIEALKRSIKEALNYFYPYYIRCKRLSVFLNTFVRKYRMPLYIALKALYEEGDCIIKNNRDLSTWSPKFLLYGAQACRKGKAVEHYVEGSDRIDAIAGMVNNKVEAQELCKPFNLVF